MTILKKFIWLLLSLQAPLPADIASAESRAIAFQSDGKTISAGIVLQNKTTNLALVRYSASGTIDTTFGVNGLAILSLGQQTEANAIAVQSNDAIISAGFTVHEDYTCAILTRYTASGSLDTTFGADGSGYTIETLQASQIADVKIQNDGKIIVCGTQSIDGQLHLFVIRYTSDGLRDSTFGDDGLVITLIGYQAGALGLGLQSDGKIVVCGFSNDADRRIVLVRYALDGSLDTSYGSNGFAITQIGQSAQAEAVVIDGNDNAFVAGISDNKFLVARYAPNGSLDASFGINGIFLRTLGSRSSAYSLCLQPDGKTLVCGFSDNLLALIRLTPEGSLDLNFNEDGVVTESISSNNCAKAILFSENNKIMVSGSSDEDLILLRYEIDGSRDTSWVLNGIINHDSAFQNPVTLILDAKASGVDGGTFTAGSWIARELNTIITDSTRVELGTRNFSLQPGIYEISVAAPAYMCGNHKIRVQNVTSNTTEKHGTAAYSSSIAEGSVSNSLLEVTLIVATPTVYEIQHRCSASKIDNGFGIATGFDDSEVYTIVKINEK